MNRTLSNKEMQTFWRVANKLAHGTDNDLLRVAALLIGIAPLAEAAKSVGADLPDLLKRCELAGRQGASHRVGCVGRRILPLTPSKALQRDVGFGRRPFNTAVLIWETRVFLCYP